MTTMLTWYLLGLLHAAVVAAVALLVYRIWKRRQLWTNAAPLPPCRTLSSYWSVFSSSSWLE